jgi:tRNA-Thr(GGU) m(6)t(6)A37 methyltransferase TsaA
VKLAHSARVAAGELVLNPIGFVRSPFRERSEAPRQSVLARDVCGTIELCASAELADALSDLERWSHVWVLYWFHLNHHYRPKVEAPRSRQKRGVLATRAPYRPNPIGLSVVALQRVEGHTLHVRGLDMLDGTPVLDIKPYVPYTDAIVDAGSGWLSDDAAGARDPGPRFAVRYAELANAQLTFLREHGQLDLNPDIERVLCAGPTPHAYRRIRKQADGYVLAVRDWRVGFTLEASEVCVQWVGTGYRPRRLHRDASTENALWLHRAFAERFPPRVTSNT